MNNLRTEPAHDPQWRDVGAKMSSSVLRHDLRTGPRGCLIPALAILVIVVGLDLLAGDPVGAWLISIIDSIIRTGT
jgi:hypothetical protein